MTDRVDRSIDTTTSGRALDDITRPLLREVNRRATERLGYRETLADGVQRAAPWPNTRW